MIEIWAHRLSNTTVEAVRLDEDNAEQVAVWATGSQVVEEIDPFNEGEMQPGLNVRTPSGFVRASLGAFIVKYRGDFHVMHSRIFEASYIPMETPREAPKGARSALGFNDPFDDTPRLS